VSEIVGQGPAVVRRRITRWQSQGRPTTERKEQAPPSCHGQVAASHRAGRKYQFQLGQTLAQDCGDPGKEYGASSHILTHKHNSSVPAHQEVIDTIKSNCDVVIAGVGD
jgi:hypothetical protein